MEEAVKEIAVFKKEVPEIFINGKDAVPVFYADQLKGHVCSSFHGIFVTTCRTEPAMAAERDKFQLPAFGTAILGPAVGRITTINHLLDVFFYSVTRMKDINHFFIMF